MLYGNLKFELPEHGTCRQTRGDVVYIYKYMDSWKTSSGERSRNRKKKMIGRLVKDEDGREFLMPNDAYFELYGKPKPLDKIDWGQTRHPGRHSVIHKESGFVRTSLFQLAAMVSLMKLGAMELLWDSFGTVTGSQIAFLAAHYASGKTSLSLLDLESERTAVFEEARGMTSQSASALLSSGITPEGKKKFFTGWIKSAAKKGNLAYDVTSLSTYSKAIRSAEYGYNRDHEQLKQVNFGLVCNEETNLPVYLVHYDGSINDKTNLISVLQQLKERGIPEDVTFVMDNGFASTKNIEFMLREKISFVMGIPVNSWKSVGQQVENWASSQVINNESLIRDLKFGQPESSHVYQCGTLDHEWHGSRVKLHCYRALDRYSDEISKLHILTDECVGYIAAHHAFPEEEKYQRVKEFFDRTGKTWTLNNERLNKKFSTMSCFALFSSPELNLSARGALVRYRWKDADEKMFDCLKNDIGMRRLQVNKDDAVNGLAFVLFLAVLIRKAMFNECCEEMKKNNLSFTDIVEILHVRTGELNHDGSVRSLNTVPKLCRNLFDAMIDGGLQGAGKVKGYGEKKRSFVIPR